MTVYSYIYDRDNNHYFVEHVLPTKRFKHLPKIEEESDQIPVQSEEEKQAIKDKTTHEANMRRWQYIYSSEVKN
jgi:hypothetical protein